MTLFKIPASIFPACDSRRAYLPLSSRAFTLLSKNESKSKAVPLHTMVALGGRGDVAHTHSSPRHLMGTRGQCHAPAALCPGEWTPGTHCTGGWVGLRTGLDTEIRGKILCLCRGSNLDHPVVQSVVKHSTD
jgi:hypothetical protein